MGYVKTNKERIESISQNESDQDLIRSALIAELDAVSLYITQISNLNDVRAKEVLLHIADEEKEHISELFCLLSYLDRKQNEINRQVSTKTCIKK